MTSADSSSPCDGDLLDALRLHLAPGVGPRCYQLLMQRFGSPAGVKVATRDELLSVPGIGPKVASSIIASRTSAAAEQELARCRDLQVQVVRHGKPGYPPWLTEIPDPPPVLFTKGDFAARDRLAVGVVGSRRCTLYGQQQAEKLSWGLAKAGVTIVSGLARGIDAAAHKGAIVADGRTIAVLATGLEEIYPPEHEDLAREVAAHGAVVSEAPLRQAAIPGIFPQRNRIISGLSLGILVVEAARNSGALHTARHALEQGRDVFALPGRVDSVASEGCHDLIRDGAMLVRSVDDILEALGPLTAPTPTSPGEIVRSPQELLLNDQEREVLNLLGPEPRPIDEVLQRSAIETSRVLQTLTILEMKRLIRRLPGGQLCRI